MKLWEGNVFSYVCLSVCSQVPGHVYICSLEYPTALFLNHTDTLGLAPSPPSPYRTPLGVFKIVQFDLTGWLESEQLAFD